MNFNHKNSYTSELKSTDIYDLIVCGGGPAGFPSALAAARRGLRVLIIEAKHQLGGTGTTGLVSHWLGGRQSDGEWVIGGIYKELSETAAEKGIAVLPDPADYKDTKYAPHGIHKGQLLVGIPFDPFSMAPFLERLLLDAGVEIVYESWVVDVIRVGSAISHVVVAGKDGLKAVAARFFVDATGDADVAAAAGCGFEYGDNDGRPMSVSLIIHLENVNEDELMRYIYDEDDPRYLKMLEKLRGRGINCFNYQMIIFVKMNRDGYFMINGRALTEIDGTDPESRTHAYITERAKIDETIELFRKHWPGCAGITLRAVSANLGVRESRRIHAINRMTVKDVIEKKAIADTIGFTAYPWDVNKGAGDVDPKSLSKPPVIPIPYSVMVPVAVSNVICPGRAIDCERIVLGPMRVQAPIMAMGEAAGTAASMAVKGGCGFADIDTDVLRSALTDAGGIV